MKIRKLFSIYYSDQNGRTYKAEVDFTLANNKRARERKRFFRKIRKDALRARNNGETTKSDVAIVGDWLAQELRGIINGDESNGWVQLYAEFINENTFNVVGVLYIGDLKRDLFMVFLNEEENELMKAGVELFAAKSKLNGKKDAPIHTDQ